MNALDSAHRKIVDLIAEVQANQSSIVSEEDAKVQIITRILTEVLGWSTSDIGAERKHEAGFSDYLMSLSGQPAFVVEAKRSGKFKIAVAELTKARTTKLSSPALKGADDGILQAFRYASEEGLPFSILTDGENWIVFKTHIPGKNYREMEAYVFPSLASIENDFSLFWDLLAKQQVAKRIYSRLFDELHNQRITLDQKLSAPLSEESIKISQKSPLAFDLDRVFDVYFGKMRGDDDPDLLIECFVETKESRLADFSLEKMTAKVLGNIRPDDKDIDVHLESLVRSAVDIDEGQTVFIVGPTGAGKTTFLDRFFRKTLSEGLRDRCVDVRVSCLDSAGDHSNIVSWMIDRLIEEIEAQLFEDGIPRWEDLQGMYFREYRRRAEGTGSQLYKSDKEQFKVEFGRFLEERVEADREGHLKRLLSDIVVNRSRLPILIIDNIDEFSFEQKAAIFQLSQALRRYAKHALVIFPITDKSAWSFSKSDIFGIYSSRSFFLPTPSPRDVFRKRIDYLRNKTDSDKTVETKEAYFTSKGIRVSIDNLNAFAAVLDEVFVGHEFTSKTLGELSNYNIRRTLALARRVITSSVFTVDQLISAYTTGQPINTGFLKFTAALMKGDYEFYRQSDQHEIFPIFQVDTKYRYSPLLALRVLYFLEAISLSGRTVEDRHVSVQSIVDYFDVLGCPESSCLHVINGLFEANLIEPYDVSVPSISIGQKLTITHSGRAHIQLATTNRVFFEQMALTTSITNETTADEIRGKCFGSGNHGDRFDAIRKKFAQYLLVEDATYVQQGSTSPSYENQADLILRISKNLNADAVGEERITSSKFKISGIVDWFDPKKGFGFVNFFGVSGGVFIHMETIKKSGFEEVNDGDDIVCDIGVSSKGISVTKIYGIRTDPSEIEIAECTVVRLFKDRGYGFVQLKQTDRTAFFHFSALSTKALSALTEGLEIKAELKADQDGTALQVRKVISIQGILEIQ